MKKLFVYLQENKIIYYSLKVNGKPVQYGATCELRVINDEFGLDLIEEDLNPFINITI